MSKTVVLTKEECHSELPEFYETVVKRLGVPLIDVEFFDCRHIRVSKDVMDEIFNAMREKIVDTKTRILVIFGSIVVRKRTSMS